jgi:hypothetical protein
MKLALRVCLGTLASSKAKYGISGSMWRYTGVAGKFGGEPMYLFMIRTPGSRKYAESSIHEVIN